MSTIYCTYLTIYRGHRLPPFYIGSSTVQRVESDYRGSVLSKKYKETWKHELKKHPELFKTKIISLHETSKEAREKELKLQKALNVVESTLYINQAYATVKGHFGVVVTGKNNPNYGKIGEKNPKSINFWAIDPDGVKYIETGVIQFAKLHNLCSSAIIKVMKGKYKHHKNWTFGYMEKSDRLKVPSKKSRPKTDHTIYKFFNTQTQETFEGYRTNFIRKYNLLHSQVCQLVNNKCHHHHNWILLEKSHQPVIEKTRKNIKGKNHPKFDHSIYKFFNTETQETFEGHRFDFMHKYGITNVSALVHSRCKSHRNWILLEKLT
jgi:hypothetical protein